MDTADIQKRQRMHFIAVGAILILALAIAGSVLAGFSNFYLIFGVAAIQVAIILTAMMHARTDGPWVRGVLIFAAFFVAALVALMVLGLRSTVQGTQRIEPAPAAESPAAEAH